MSTDGQLARVLLEALGPEDLEAFVRRLPDEAIDALAQRLAGRLGNGGDGWLTTRDAAAYAGCTVNALHKAMGRREVAFSQDCKGGKAWFKRADLDDWRA